MESPKGLKVAILVTNGFEQSELPKAVEFVKAFFDIPASNRAMIEPFGSARGQTHQAV